MKKYPPRTHNKANRVNHSLMAKAVPELFICTHRHSPMPMAKSLVKFKPTPIGLPGSPSTQPQPEPVAV